MFVCASLISVLIIAVLVRIIMPGRNILERFFVHMQA